MKTFIWQGKMVSAGQKELAVIQNAGRAEALRGFVEFLKKGSAFRSRNVQTKFEKTFATPAA